MPKKEELKKSFLDAWPHERVKKMTIDEYTNLNKDDSFCYWLESKTEVLGSIWGGSAYKFGIYKRNNTDKDDTRSAYKTDGDYGWAAKYGDTVDEAFQNIKGIIVDIIEAVQEDNLEAIDDFDLGPATKWKIAFLYSDYQVVNIFKRSAIYDIAKRKGLDDANQKPISELHRYLISQKPQNAPYFDYTEQLWQEYNRTLESEEMLQSKTMQLSNNKNMGLNTILFGPPGTGKTYHTVDYALSIVDAKFYKENKDDRKELVKRFKELLITDWDNPKQGRIAATTFHQSFTYEDFIEGIKPELSSENEQGKGEEQFEETEKKENNISYTIEDGIFKRIGKLARQDSGGEVEKTKGRLKWDRETFNKAEFYKLSLGDINMPEDEEIYEYCIKENKVAIGFLWDTDLSNKDEAEIRNLSKQNPELDDHDCRSMAMFKSNMKKGYYVVIPNGNHKFRAIGRLTGDYEYNPNSPIRYNHFRDVEWLATDLDLSVDLIYNKNFMQQTIYHLRKKDVKPEFFIKSKASTAEGKSYVLIIDEINRGNIAQIFGELITLIEEDKREGLQEQMEVSLPYSKKPFSVPSNLYLVGTMNTADRSVEALDTALRRRFQFEEIPPRSQIIAKEGKTENGAIEIDGESILLPDLLRTINQRIEKILDKDHLIGHSYFMDIENWHDLKTVFQQNIIPLLEEYFYGDKGKIQLILGKGFIESMDGQENENIFPETDYNDQEIFEDRIIWRIKDNWKKSEENFLAALSELNIQN